ncbi:hypothetical protein B5M09_009786 [Aphanomyces astaci]|uniref:SAM domain-containing protein n=1 Tax=Aphanomyces astaci TaxID=112090 RepID=A0A3R8D230_APHAT|nr:hypothetical protein B5M09_009786 [Aphanomyces astaci]
MGAGASVDVVTKEQCQSLYGDLFNDAEWAKQAVDGVVTRDKLTTAFSALTDAFLTHDWGTDGTTHKNVSVINTLLKARGITTWFDEEKMEGNVKKQMIHGIDNARAIVVFVTQRYIDKVGGNNAEDNCQLEFNYAARRKTASKMIPVLIDPSPTLKNTANWTGEVGFVLGGHLYLDLSSAFGNDALLASRIDELVTKIVSVAGTPLSQRFQSAHHDAVPPPTGGPSTPRTASATISTVPLASLTQHQVGTLLNNLTCSKYSAVFVENEITGEVLCGVESADEVKELGVTLAPKARLLFDKLSEFKASGVPSHLLKATEPSPPALVSTPPHKSFEELKAAILPSNWVQLYKYPLESNGANILSAHKLTWPTPACSVSVLGGLVTTGDYADMMKDNWEFYRLEALASRLDKHEFLLTFKIKVARGDSTPLCAGYNPWFAVDITADMCLIIQCNREAQGFVVQLNGNPWLMPIDTWLDVAVLMDVPHSVIQVVINTDRMDTIPLPPAFTFTTRDMPTEGNEFYLLRRDTMTKLFSGHLRKIELYSTLPLTRPQPMIQGSDPTSHVRHLSQLAEWTNGLNCLCNYVDMKVNVVDSVDGTNVVVESAQRPARFGLTILIFVGTAMLLPQGSFIHPELGTYFDGDYYGEAYNQSAMTRAGGNFGLHLNNYDFVFATRVATMGPCYVMNMGSSHRYFVVQITIQRNLVVLLNCHSVSHDVKEKGVILTLEHNTWHDIAVKMQGKAIHVAVDGRAMDTIALTDDFEFTAGPGEDTKLLLVNFSCGGCFYGYMAFIALWSSDCPVEVDDNNTVLHL